MTSKKFIDGCRRRKPNTIASSIARAIRLHIFILLLLSPYLLGFVPADTSFSIASAGAGGGHYVYYDCSGAHPTDFGEAGLSYVHKYSSPFHAGFTVNGAAGKGIPVFFLYPDLAVDWRYFSLGTTGLRIGATDDAYLEVKGLDEVPMFSGKGWMRAGIGVAGKENGLVSHVWFGANVGPYDPGAAAQLEFLLSPNRYLFISGRYGTDEHKAPAYGFSVGYRLRY